MSRVEHVIFWILVSILIVIAVVAFGFGIMKHQAVIEALRQTL